MAFAETRHAAARRQQRAIPPDALDLLWTFGSVTRHRGADCLYFDRMARRRAAAALSEADLLRHERYLNTYAVVANNGSVITVAWRTRRLRRA